MKQVLYLRSPSPQLLALPHNPHDLSTPCSLTFSSVLFSWVLFSCLSFKQPWPCPVFFFLSALDSSKCSGHFLSLAYNKNLSPNRRVILAVPKLHPFAYTFYSPRPPQNNKLLSILLAKNSQELNIKTLFLKMSQNMKKNKQKKNKTSSVGSLLHSWACNYRHVPTHSAHTVCHAKNNFKESPSKCLLATIQELLLGFHIILWPP